MTERPTLKQIGRIAGLSHVAVSKALRDAPDISAATKERVKKIADELGYTPTWPPGTYTSDVPAPLAWWSPP